MCVRLVQLTYTQKFIMRYRTVMTISKLSAICFQYKFVFKMHEKRYTMSICTFCHQLVPVINKCADTLTSHISDQTGEMVEIRKYEVKLNKFNNNVLTLPTYI